MKNKMLRVVEAVMRLICNQPMDVQSNSKVIERVPKVERIEIDYDKLADAIIKAQKAACDIDPITDEKARNKVSASAALFSSMAELFLFFLGIVLNCVAIAIWMEKYKHLWDIEGETGIIKNALVLGKVFFQYDLWMIAMILFGILSFASGFEIGKEQDRHYIVAVFSAVASMAALIVALVALIK